MNSENIYIGTIILWNALLLIIALFSFQGSIHFGWGMADIMVLGLILVVLLIVDLIFIFSLKEASLFFTKRKFIVVSSLCFLIYIFLQMTLLRGPASPWNGNLFF